MPEQKNPRPARGPGRKNVPEKGPETRPQKPARPTRKPPAISSKTPIKPAFTPARSEPKLPRQPREDKFPLDFDPDQLEYVIVAEISTPFGLRGAVKANIQTDFPERFERMAEAYLAPPGAPLNAPRQKYKIISARVQTEKQVIFRFEEITKNEQADKLRGFTVAVPRTEVMPLPEGEFYIFQIIGLEVVTTGGENIGKVVNVETRPANDIYFVRSPKYDKDILLPAIKDIVKNIDLENGKMTIEWMEGLI